MLSKNVKEITNPFDTIFISKSQWEKAIEKLHPELGTVYGGIRVIVSNVLEDNQILLVSNNKIVAIVNLGEKLPLD